MKSIDSASPIFGELAADLLDEGYSIRFTVRGHSMRPLVLDGDVITFQAVDGRGVRTGDVVLYLAGPGKLVVHRALFGFRSGTGRPICMRGDAQQACDSVRPEQVLARGMRLQRGKKTVILSRFHVRLAATVFLQLRAIWRGLVPGSHCGRALCP